MNLSEFVKKVKAIHSYAILDLDCSPTSNVPYMSLLAIEERDALTLKNRSVM